MFTSTRRDPHTGSCCYCGWSVPAAAAQPCLGAAISAAALATAPGAGAQAPSSAPHRGEPPASVSVPPLQFRQAMARRLRADGQAAQARRALRPSA